MTNSNTGIYYLCLLFICTTLLLGCAKKDDSVPAPSISSISVIPGNPTASKGANQQFRAIGTFSDATTRDVSAEVKWVSSDARIASVFNSGLNTGLVRGNEAGSVTITASMGTVSASTSLTISPDAHPGDIWTVRSTGLPLYSLVWSGTQFVAVGYNGRIIASSDGISWVSRTSGSAAVLFGVTWTGAEFVAVGSGNTILTSPDSVSWTLRTSLADVSLTSVAGSGSQLVAVGRAGVIITSPDGLTWTPQVSGTQTDLLRVIWTGTQFVAVGGFPGFCDWGCIPGVGVILTSPDGVVWTSRTIEGASLLNGITLCGTQLVAIGDAGIITSPDGVTWSPKNAGHFYGSTNSALPNGAGLAVACSETNIVVVGTVGEVITSPDGEIWSQQTVTTSDWFFDIAWSGQQFVAVGVMSGTILTSP